MGDCATQPSVRQIAICLNGMPGGEKIATYGDEKMVDHWRNNTPHSLPPHRRAGGFVACAERARRCAVGVWRSGQPHAAVHATPHVHARRLSPYANPHAHTNSHWHAHAQRYEPARRYSDGRGAYGGAHRSTITHAGARHANAGDGDDDTRAANGHPPASMDRL